jgi:hypothetical protein
MRRSDLSRNWRTKWDWGNKKEKKREKEREQERENKKFSWKNSKGKMKKDWRGWRKSKRESINRSWERGKEKHRGRRRRMKNWRENLDRRDWISQCSLPACFLALVVDMALEAEASASEVPNSTFLAIAATWIPVQPPLLKPTRHSMKGLVPRGKTGILIWDTKSTERQFTERNDL